VLKTYLKTNAREKHKLYLWIDNNSVRELWTREMTDAPLIVVV